MLRVSGKKKEPKPKLFGPDIFGWGGGLEGVVGAEKFGMALQAKETKLFLGGISRDFCRDIQEAPEKCLRRPGLSDSYF